MEAVGRGRPAMHHGKRRSSFLSLFGPLSILILFGIWAAGLILGFACLHWSLGTPLKRSGKRPGLEVYSYFSGVTFFTLGYGDSRRAGRGTVPGGGRDGHRLGFLAVVISYLPVLYQAFSRREVTISLLDARAARRRRPARCSTVARHGDIALLDRFLAEWERWAAEVLESHSRSRC